MSGGHGGGTSQEDGTGGVKVKLDGEALGVLPPAHAIAAAKEVEGPQVRRGGVFA